MGSPGAKVWDRIMKMSKEAKLNLELNSPALQCCSELELIPTEIGQD